MTNLLCVASKNFVEKYKSCIESQKNYCKRMGYEYQLISGLDQSKNWKREKVHQLSNILNNKNTDVVIIDADCYIRNICPPFDTFLTENKSIYYAKGKSNRLNSGFLYFKNNYVSKKFIVELQEKLKLPIPKGKGFFVTKEGENGHLIWLKSEWIEKEKDVFCEIPKLWNCSSPSLKNDAYILHFTNDLKKEYYKYK